MRYLAARVIQNDKDIQDLKTEGGYSEEVHHPGDWQVIAQGGQPILGFSGSSFGLDQVFPDGSGQGGGSMPTK